MHKKFLEFDFRVRVIFKKNLCNSRHRISQFGNIWTVQATNFNKLTDTRSW